MNSKSRMSTNRLQVVGKQLPRVDARSKVTGKAVYTADLNFPGMLYAKTLWSKHPHAEIIRIDTSKARSLNGVEAVITSKDIIGPNRSYFGFLPREILPSKKVKSYGDAIAVIAAQSEDIAQRALKLIHVEYHPLTSVFDPISAMDKNAPQIGDDGNIVYELHTKKGVVEKGFRKAEVILEREYKTQCIDHAYIEPEAAIAIPKEDNMVVYVSAHYPHQMRVTVANALGYPQNKVQIIQPAVGGGFGGKAEHVSLIAARVALLAYKTGKPVKIVYSREESMLESSKRHPYIMKYKIGATRDGKIVALKSHCVSDAGAHSSASPFVLFRSHVHAGGPYEIPNAEIDSYSVFTNNIFSASMRGFGSPQVCFAMESLMDELAHELKMDPIALRLKNALKNGSRTVTGQLLKGHRVSIRDILKKAKALSKWDRKVNKQMKSGQIRYGIGVACSYRGVSFGGEGIDYGLVRVAIQRDGSIIISCGVTEVGQGASTVLTQIAAEAFGVKPERIRYLNVNTDHTPYMLSTSASRGTIMGGNAIIKAIDTLKKQMVKIAANILKSKKTDIVFQDDWVFRKNQPSSKLSFEELTKICYGKMVDLNAMGKYLPPRITWDAKKGRGSAYFTYSYNANVAEVEVNLETNQAKVLRFYALHDPGRVINPTTAKGQVYGGISWALGYALSEHIIMTKGQLKTKNFDKYKIPRAKDMPEIIIEFVENPDPDGPFGAKSLGESPLEIGAPAIANAIFNATGTRIRTLPITKNKLS